MSWQIVLPVVDPYETLAIPLVSELTALVADEEDQLVTRQLLDTCHELALMAGKTVMVGTITEMLETATSQERRSWLDFYRNKAGLPARKDVEVQAQLDEARAHRLAHPVGLPRLSPSGALVEVNELDDAREQSQAEIDTRRREGRRLERVDEAAAARARTAARAAMRAAEEPKLRP